jgi:GT2 family glycosyltransferase
MSQTYDQSAPKFVGKTRIETMVGKLDAGVDVRIKSTASGFFMSQQAQRSRATAASIDPGRIAMAVSKTDERQAVAAFALASRLFQAGWYRARAGAIENSSVYEHYLKVGIPRLISPSPLFDVDYYASRFREIDFRKVNPIQHYLSTPLAQRASTHPLFDRHFYASADPQLPSNVDPLIHYLTSADSRNRQPHLLFDPEYYLGINPDVASSGLLPLLHFVQFGSSEGRSPHPLFSVQWYLDKCHEAPSCENALIHYLQVGQSQRYSPHPLFDPNWYLAQTDDPAASAAPLRHYLERGSALGISPHPLFDPAWYRRTQLEDEGEAIEPLCYFLKTGAALRHDPNPLFSTSWYHARNPEVLDAKNALIHYLVRGAAELRDPHPAFSAADYVRRHPECASLNPLVHALSTNRPGTGRPLAIPAIPSAPTAPGQIALAKASKSGDEFSLLPLSRQSLAQALTAFSDVGAALRIVNYFLIIDWFDPSESASKLSRQEKIATLVERLQQLSEQANDDRPIAATVIIPVYGQVEYTIASVLSLLEHKAAARYEILIGNDRSTDETCTVFEAVGGIVRCITHEINNGFLTNCNKTARSALGEYIVLLNNDTFVCDNWLDELLRPFESFKSVGAVGSRLLMADGSLQEAGGIIWNDASGWNFGRGQHADLPKFNYLKEVDYVSGASVAVPRSLWNELGGFDKRYAPAYFEDTDLAFSLRAKGLRVIYSPTSVVVHHEGVSHGTDISSGIKRFQIENQLKFIEKWDAILASEQFENGQHVFVARDRSADRPRLLVIDHYFPQPDRDAGSRSMYDCCRIFADAGFQIYFWPENLYHDRQYAKALQELGIESLYGPHLVNQFPAWIKENGPYLDYVFLSRPHISEKFIDDVKQHSEAKVLFYGHDLHHVRLQREFDVTKEEKLLAEIEYWQGLEAKLWDQSDVIYYPSAEEVRRVKMILPDKCVRFLPLFVYDDAELSNTRSKVERDRATLPSVMFVAGFRHRPNVDAALWLVRNILPLVRQEVPGTSLILAGSNPPPEVTALASDHVLVTGYVTDPLLRHLYDSTATVVAPLRFGAGMKGKIVEALRFGVPTVTTSIGAEGLDAAHEYLEIGDSANTIARGIIKLLRDPKLRRIRALRGITQIQKDFSYSSAVKRMSQNIPELAPLLDGLGILRRQEK